MKATYIDHMGSDLSVVNAARVSFKKTSEEFSFLDEKLISYLARHNHWTPFAHTAITVHVKAPLFVARQLGKHQVGMVWNEVSRRYVTEEPEFYRFSEYRMASPNVKQGSSDQTLVPMGQEGRCPVCGDVFTAQSNHSIYCNPNCQSKGWRSTPEGWKSRKWSSLKQSAEKRGLEFSITKEDIPNPTHCCYLGVELAYDGTELTGASASVDRIDNSKGYVPGNLQTISNQANTMKGVATEEEIVKFSKAALLRHGGFMVPQVDSLDLYHEEMRRLYRHLIENEGMCAEQARGFMPQTLFTEWYWTGNLVSFANMWKLRTDSHTQRETQDVARQIGEIIQPLFPVSWSALTNAT